jgi:hypothetical protein
VRGATYHFNLGLNLFGAIDHIGHTSDAELVDAPIVVSDKFGDVWPTDHYPLVADFRLGRRSLILRAMILMAARKLLGSRCPSSSPLRRREAQRHKRC